MIAFFYCVAVAAAVAVIAEYCTILLIFLLKLNYFTNFLSFYVYLYRF